MCVFLSVQSSKSLYSPVRTEYVTRQETTITGDAAASLSLSLYLSICHTYTQTLSLPVSLSGQGIHSGAEVEWRLSILLKTPLVFFVISGSSLFITFLSLYFSKLCSETEQFFSSMYSFFQFFTVGRLTVHHNDNLTPDLPLLEPT